MDDTVYQCPECNFNTDNLVNLDLHINKVHDYSIDDDDIDHEQDLHFHGHAKVSKDAKSTIYMAAAAAHPYHTNKLNMSDDYDDDDDNDDDEDDDDDDDDDENEQGELKIHEEDNDDYEDLQSSSINQSYNMLNTTQPVVVTNTRPPSSQHKPNKHKRDQSASRARHHQTRIPNTDNHYERQYTCKSCSYLTNNPRAILYHRKEVHAERIPIYECAHCQYASQYSGKVERHTLLRHKITDANNNMSATTTTTNTSIITSNKQHTSTPNKHAAKQQQQESNESSSSFTDNTQLQSPDASGHLAQQQLTFQCNKCPCKYKRSNDLYKHLRLKHMNDGSAQSAPLATTTTTTTTMADSDFYLNGIKTENDNNEACHQDNDTSFLNTSTNNNNNNNGMGRHECPYCTYTVDDSQTCHRTDYINHINEHLCGKTYRCILCNSIYKYRGDCVVHLKRKHQKNDLIAQQYVEKFLLHEQQALTLNEVYMKLKPKIYLDLDNDKKLFGCSYCDYKANYKGDVYKHQTRRHPSFVKNIRALEQQEQQEQPKTAIDAVAYVYDNNKPQQDDNDYGNNNNNDDEDEDDGHDHDYDEQQNKSSATALLAASIDDDDQDVQYLYECHLCPYKAKNHAKLQFHLATHDNLKPYMCPVCKRRANFKWDIQKHLRKVHMDADSEVICLTQNEARQTIGKYIEYYGQNQRTLSTSSSSTSTPIGRGLDNNNNTSSSYAYHAMMDVSPSKHSMRERKYKCSLCNRTSKWQWDIRKHLRTVHKVTANEGDVIVLDDKDLVCHGQIVHHHRHQQQQQQHYTIPRAQHKPHVMSTTTTTTTRTTKTIATPVASVKQEPVQQQQPKAPSTKTINLMSIGSDATGNKKFKCTMCPYRSNWKADLFRHIRKRHFIGQPTIENVIIMTPDEAACTIDDYEQTHGIYIRKRSRCVDDYAHNHQQTTTSTSTPLATSNCKRQRLDSNSSKTTNGHNNNECTRQQLPLSPPQSTTSNTTTMTTMTTGVCMADVDDIDAMSPFGIVAQQQQREPKQGDDTVKTFQCLKCFYKTIRKADLLRHLKVRHSLHASLLSKYMKISFDNKIQAKMNAKSLTTGLAGDGCDQVDLQFAPQTTMVNKNYYKCNVCAYKSEWRYSVKKHIISQHWQIQHANVVKCNFKNIDEFNMINNSSCDNAETPNDGTDTANNADKHHHNHHQSGNCSETTTGGCNQLILPNGKSYTSAFVLTSANNNNNSNNNNSSMNSADASLMMMMGTNGDLDPNCTKKKMYFCESCPYKTNNYCNLKQHLLQHRPEAGIAKCRYCPYYVGMSRLLKQHEILHMEYEPRTSTSFIGDSPVPSNNTQNNMDDDDDDDNQEDHADHNENDNDKIVDQDGQTAKSTSSTSSVSTLSPSSSTVSARKSNKSFDCTDFTDGQDQKVKIKQTGCKLYRCKYCSFKHTSVDAAKAHGLTHVMEKEKNKLFTNDAMLLKCTFCDHTSKNTFESNQHLLYHIENKSCFPKDFLLQALKMPTANSADLLLKASSLAKSPKLPNASKVHVNNNKNNNKTTHHHTHHQIEPEYIDIAEYEKLFAVLQEAAGTS